MRAATRQIVVKAAMGVSVVVALGLSGCMSGKRSSGSATAGRSPAVATSYAPALDKAKSPIPVNSPTGASSTSIATAMGTTVGTSGSGVTEANAPMSATSAEPAPLRDVVMSGSGEVSGLPATVNQFGEFDNKPSRTVDSSGAINLQQQSTLSEGYDSDISVDPTGKWMAFASTRNSRRSDIYLQRVSGQSVVQLTNDSADDVAPSFSPDGKKLAFCSTRSGNWDIYVMDCDGRNVVQVTSGAAQDLYPSFSPDGTRIVYSSLSSQSDQWELWVADLEGGQKRMIGYGLFPSWSPSKSVDRIAFQRARQRGSRWFSVWTLDLVDGEARRIAEVASSGNAAIVHPTWSPDGLRMTFSTIVDPQETVNGRPKGQQDVWIMDADGTNRRRLTDGRGSNLMPWWGADNRIYFVSDRGGKECIWSVGVGQLPATVASDDFPSTETNTRPGQSAVGAAETGVIGR